MLLYGIMLCGGGEKKNRIVKTTRILGADYGVRTRYLHLGKVALYQMS